MKSAWLALLQAIWPDDAEKPASGAGRGYVPTLEPEGAEDDHVLWRHASTLGHWEQLVDLTDPENPAFLFYGDGSPIMLWVED